MKKQHPLFTCKWLLSFLLLCFVFFACSGPQKADVKPSPGSETHAGYEIAPELNTRDFVLASQMKSPYYKLDETVYSYGFMNVYTISAVSGTFTAVGNHRLHEVIQEIKAIEAIREIKKSRMFAEAINNAASNPKYAARRIILYPLDTSLGIPQGIWRYANRFDLQNEDPLTIPPAGYPAYLEGFATVKRQFAYRLGIDPYSSNRLLQKELNTFSWAAFAGGMGVPLAISFIPSALRDSLETTAAAYPLKPALRDYSQAALRDANRNKLKEMDVKKSIAESFLDHRDYSPREQTIMTEALYGMGEAKYKEIFFKLAISAASEADAYFFRRVAEMMERYNTRISPIVKVFNVDGYPVCLAKNDAAVWLLPADYASWTPGFAGFVHNINRFYPAKKGFQNREIWVSGNVSSRSKRELNTLNLRVFEQVF
jgi:hypothetical protein